MKQRLLDMGGGASVSAPRITDISAYQVVNLKQLPSAIEDSLYIQEKFPLIIDPTGQAGRFLKYQLGSYTRSDDIQHFTAEHLNRYLVSALQFGRTLTVSFESLEGVDASLFKPALFPAEVVDRSKFYSDGIWQSILKPNLGDPKEDEFTPSLDFVFAIVTAQSFIPEFLASSMNVITVCDNSAKDSKSNNNTGANYSELDGIAEMYGAKEIVRYIVIPSSGIIMRIHIYVSLTFFMDRNSTQLVEAAFDGDIDEVIFVICEYTHCL